MRVIVLVVLGLAAGIFARDLHAGKPDRAASAIDMFRTYCLPFARGERIAPAATLVSKDGASVDPVGKIALELVKTRCAVSDRDDRLNEEERRALTAAAIALVESELPMFEPVDEHGFETWDAYLAWTQDRDDDPRRLQIILSRFEKNSPTILLIGRRP